MLARAQDDPGKADDASVSTCKGDHVTSNDGRACGSMTPFAVIASAVARTTGRGGYWKTRPTITRLLWLAPIGTVVLAISLIVMLLTGQLGGAAEAEAALLTLALLALTAGLGVGLWLHWAIAQPLQQLCAGNEIAAIGTTEVPSVGIPREILLLAGKLQVQASLTALRRDRLTGLLSATAFHEVCGQEIEAARQNGSCWALLVLDVHRLRDINIGHGYALGDEVLRQVARRIVAVSPPAAVAARLGGDRFGLFVPIQGRDKLAGLLGMVTATLSHSFRVQGCDIEALGSAGGAVFPDHGSTFASLLRAAELALDDARQRGEAGWSVFSPRMGQTMAAQGALEKELRRALEQNVLILHYQPQVELASGRIVGVEALLRWPHPEKGMIPPATFIPAAEASGLIRPLGAWVLGEACRAAQRWRGCGLTTSISVNVSAAQLKHQDLSGLVAQVLRSTGLPPDLLELELTESMFVDPSQLTIRRSIQAVAAMGVHLVIDDFGTGYSSLAYLKRLPVHKIKIDKSFVHDLTRDERDGAIVRSIIGLARTFGKRVLAEGVEELSQSEYLAAEGCDEAQGYYFARPLSEEACTAFLMQRIGAPDQVRQACTV